MENLERLKEEISTIEACNCVDIVMYKDDYKTVKELVSAFFESLNAWKESINERKDVDEYGRRLNQHELNSFNVAKVQFLDVLENLNIKY